MEDDGFNLVYYHRETGIKHRVKRITRHDYIIEYPDGTRVSVTTWFLSTRFKADKSNNKRQVKVRLNFKKVS